MTELLFLSRVFQMVISSMGVIYGMRCSVRSCGDFRIAQKSRKYTASNKETMIYLARELFVKETLCLLSQVALLLVGIVRVFIIPTNSAVTIQGILFGILLGFVSAMLFYASYRTTGVCKRLEHM